MDDQNTQPTQPLGSLNFTPASPEVPAAPEASVESIVPNIETQPVKIEKEPVKENEPIYNAEKPSGQSDDDTATTKTKTAQKTPAKIVDKSADVTKLHHIEKPGDKLTEEADHEEEEFIQKTEAAHGRK